MVSNIKAAKNNPLPLAKPIPNKPPIPGNKKKGIPYLTNLPRTIDDIDTLKPKVKVTPKIEITKDHPKETKIIIPASSSIKTTAALKIKIPDALKKTHYSDIELQEFKSIINDKLASSRS
jgi:hypothetical protein